MRSSRLCSIAAWVCLIFVLSATTVRAQATSSTGQDVNEQLPRVGEKDRLAEFERVRGFYLSGDLGVFLTFGGSAGSSNLQPYLAVHAGRDLDDTWSVQLSAGGAYVADNPPSDNELLFGSQQVSSYQLFLAGAELVGSFQLAERVALQPRIGGGIAHTSPTLTDPDDASETISSLQPQTTVAVDLAYLTLLTGFTAGVSVAGVWVFGADIPGFATSLHLRYTL
ncbi:MAG: adventurous gliding motility protein CglE [Myxococcota bacterium]